MTKKVTLNDFFKLLIGFALFEKKNFKGSEHEKFIKGLNLFVWCV